MYERTVTVFNRYPESGGCLWYPTVLEGVNLSLDRASIVRQYGRESSDRAILNVAYGGIPTMSGSGEISAPPSFGGISTSPSSESLTGSTSGGISTSAVGISTSSSSGSLASPTSGGISAESNSGVFICGKMFLPPREWRRGDGERRAATVTFSGGGQFDIFAVGRWDGGVVSDADYDADGGFYGWLCRTRDDVFAVSAVSGPFSVIPHFEITGR